MAKTTLANLIVNLLFDASSAEKSLMKFSASVEAMGAKLQAMGASLTKNLTVPLVGIGAASTAMASEYNDSIKKIGALTNAASEDVAKWSTEMLALGSAVGKSPKELSDAMFAIASAGIKGKDAMDLLTAAAKGSAAGMGSTLDVAKLGISVLNAYGTANISGAKAMDILTETAKQANTSVDALAPVMGRFLPIASELEVSFADSGAAMARLTLISGDAAAAATQFQGVLRSLLKPTEGAVKALEKAGLSTQDLRKAIKEKGLLATLEMLKDKLKDSGQELSVFFSDTEGLSGALQLVGEHATGVQETFDSVANSAGALDKAFDATGGFSRSLSQLWANLQILGIYIGEAVLPIVQQGITALNGVIVAAINIWTGLSGEAQQWIAIFGMVLAAIGPVILVVGGLVAAMGPLIAAFASFVGFVGPIIAMLGAGLAAALAGLFAFFSTWTSKALTLPEVIKTLGLQLLSGLSNLAAQAINAIMPQMNATGESVRAWIVEFGISTMETLGGLLSGVGQWMVSLGSAVASGIASELGPPIQQALDTIYLQLTGKTAEFPNKLSEIFAIANAAAQQAMAMMQQSMGAWANLAADFLLDVLQRATDKIFDWVHDQISQITDLFSQAFSGMGEEAANAISPQVSKHLNQRVFGGGDGPRPGDSPERQRRPPPGTFLGQHPGGGTAFDQWMENRGGGGGAPPSQPWLQNLNDQINNMNRGNTGGGSGATAFDQWMNSRSSSKADNVTQTISINLDGRQIARNVVKNFPSAVAAETGFRGSY